MGPEWVRASSATADTDAAEEFQAGGEPSLLDCDSGSNDFLAGCDETDHGLLMWEGEAPEEDPDVACCCRGR